MQSDMCQKFSQAGASQKKAVLACLERHFAGFDLEEIHQALARALLQLSLILRSYSDNSSQFGLPQARTLVQQLTQLLYTRQDWSNAAARGARRCACCHGWQSRYWNDIDKANWLERLGRRAAASKQAGPTCQLLQHAGRTVQLLTLSSSSPYLKSRMKRT